MCVGRRNRGKRRQIERQNKSANNRDRENEREGWRDKRTNKPDRRQEIKKREPEKVNCVSP